MHPWTSYWQCSMKWEDIRLLYTVCRTCQLLWACSLETSWCCLQRGLSAPSYRYSSAYSEAYSEELSLFGILQTAAWQVHKRIRHKNQARLSDTDSGIGARASVRLSDGASWVEGKSETCRFFKTSKKLWGTPRKMLTKHWQSAGKTCPWDGYLS